MTAPEPTEGPEIDRLTGLPDLRQLECVIAPILLRRNTSRKPLSLLLFGIDHLKELDAQQGHAVGDQIIAKTAGLLRSNVKAGDLMVRSGRDEFIIVLEDEDRIIAERVARRLVDRVADEPLEISTMAVNVSISSGVAAFPDEGTDLPTLLGSARRRLEANRKE